MTWSDDDGATWVHGAAPIDAVPSKLTNVMGAMAEGPNGILWVLYSREDGWVYCARSDDEGESWTGRPVAAVSSPAAVGIAVAENGTIGAAWSHQFEPRAPSTILFALSEDEGQSWSDPVIVPAGAPDGTFSRPVLAVRDDVWHLAMYWNIPFGAPSAMFYARSADDGRTWTSPPVLLDEKYDPRPDPASMAVDDSGHVFITWTRWDPAYEETVVFRTTAPAPPPPDLLHPNDRLVARPATNPSRSGSDLLFQLIRAGDVEVVLSDVSGRVVRRWALGSVPAGEHRLGWDARTAQGGELGRGVYYWNVRVHGPGGTMSATSRSVLVP